MSRVVMPWRNFVASRPWRCNRLREGERLVTASDGGAGGVW
jgi:hypothetical protein